ncbi:Ribulose-phosphate 3-epimerase [Candidatus Liberibacter solanacearum]|uniref:Ribulose-phosphate 3-epimerase n=1 Tax=Candidatus Liberibacter solanacearum TaxID=556287 RepID=A0A3R7QU30_9HYPH|nr:ribulose-phosphate 3-epimerase [Candidatus Liberibacter solanacearum]RPD37058.1 ribulose-phosphate 3-epimerase [Candidatus Liberibacter solanacearum]
MPLSIQIVPSILAADFSRLGEEVSDITKAGAKQIHFDVMDGHFVPNISFGADVIKSLRSYSDAVFDCHLMISSVDSHIKVFADAGCDIITLHAEFSPHIRQSLRTIRAMGKKSGIALNPETPVSVLENVIDEIDMILIMTVNPGFGGQQLINFTVPKIRQARELIGKRPIALEVDGGIKSENIRSLAQEGANLFVAGSAIFNKKEKTSYKQRLNELKKSALTIDK